jgi:hypothetical protein
MYSVDIVYCCYWLCLHSVTIHSYHWYLLHLNEWYSTLSIDTPCSVIRHCDDAWLGIFRYYSFVDVVYHSVLGDGLFVVVVLLSCLSWLAILKYKCGLASAMLCGWPQLNLNEMCPLNVSCAVVKCDHWPSLIPYSVKYSIWWYIQYSIDEVCCYIDAWCIILKWLLFSGSDIRLFWCLMWRGWLFLFGTCPTL